MNKPSMSLASGQPRQVLRLAAGGQALVVAIDAVHEILEVGRLTRVPQSPPFLRGVMNLRGAVVPVIDLAARFGLPPSTLARRSAIVVVEAQGDELQPQVVAGLLVDAVYEVLDYAPDSLEAVPSIGVLVPAQFALGMVRLPSGYAALLSMEQLLAPSQLAELIGAVGSGRGLASGVPA
jgi:purine-binding chemotaxis protein CheW